MPTKTKSTLSEMLLGKTSHPEIEMYFQIAHLKQVYRQGWLLRGISPEQCESVADHTFGVAILTMILATNHFPELDRTKLLQMALIHDLGEVYAGDIVPDAGITSEEKYRLEKESISRIFGKSPNSEEFLSLWEEYEQGNSPESRFVHQVDKLEMAFQASLYEYKLGLDLSDFFTSAGKSIETNELSDILFELDNLRKSR